MVASARATRAPGWSKSVAATKLGVCGALLYPEKKERKRERKRERGQRERETETETERDRETEREKGTRVKGHLLRVLRVSGIWEFRDVSRLNRRNCSK